MRFSDLKLWAFPSICFILFLYGMAFIVIYTYDQNLGSALTAEKKPRGEIDPEAVKREIMKLKLN